MLERLRGVAVMSCPLVVRAMGLLERALREREGDPLRDELLDEVLRILAHLATE